MLGNRDWCSCNVKFTSDHQTGTGYKYTTHGWTVVSAVVEAVVGRPFTKVATSLFWDLGLDNTYLDKPDPIIYNRARWEHEDWLQFYILSISMVYQSL